MTISSWSRNRHMHSSSPMTLAMMVINLSLSLNKSGNVYRCPILCCFLPDLATITFSDGSLSQFDIFSFQTTGIVLKNITFIKRLLHYCPFCVAMLLLNTGTPPR